MMEVDEGKGLLERRIVGKPSKEAVIDNCINNLKEGKCLDMAVCLAMGNVADAVEIICVGFIMSEISDATSLDKELLSSAVFMGMLVGGVAGGYLSDIIGRKRCLLYSLAINAIFGLLSAAAPDINYLIGCRVIGGIGIGASVPIVFSLGAEVFPSDSRGRYISLIASFWMVGAILIAFLAWIMLGDGFDGKKILPGADWRLFALASAFPVILAFFLTYYRVPESPRYLCSNGYIPEAVAVLRSISTVQVTEEDFATTAQHAQSTTNSHHPNNLNNPHLHPYPTSFPKHNHHNEGKGASTHTILGTLQLLFGPQLCRTSSILMTLWFTLNFGSYGISTWISVLFADVGIGNPYAASFIFALANLPGNVVSLWLIDSVGRRWLLSGGMILAGLSTIGFALDVHNAFVVVLFASLFNACSVAGWNSLECLSVEIFPTTARATAMGLLAACGRLGAIAGQFVNGTLESDIPLLLFVTSACSIAGGMIAWMLKHDPAGSSLGRDVDEQIASPADEQFKQEEDQEITVHNPVTAV